MEDNQLQRYKAELCGLLGIAPTQDPLIEIKRLMRAAAILNIIAELSKQHG